MLRPPGSLRLDTEEGLVPTKGCKNGGIDSHIGRWQPTGPNLISPHFPAPPPTPPSHRPHLVDHCKHIVHAGVAPHPQRRASAQPHAGGALVYLGSEKV